MSLKRGLNCTKFLYHAKIFWAVFSILAAFRPAAQLNTERASRAIFPVKMLKLKG
jgi:hypothetical protein